MVTHLCQRQSSSFSVNQGCRWHVRGSIRIWRVSGALLQLKDRRSGWNLLRIWRGLFQTRANEAKNQVQASSSRRLPESFNSSTSEPDTHGLLLCIGGKALRVCGQRNAAHISAIAAVEVLHSRVGACRGVRTSPFCINNRMSYCCTNQAVFY